MEEGVSMEGIFNSGGNLDGKEELGWWRGISMVKGHSGGVGNLAKGILKEEGGAILIISMVGGKGELSGSLWRGTQGGQ